MYASGGYEVVGGQLGHQDVVPERPEEVGPSGGGETAKDPHRCEVVESRLGGAPG